VSTRKQRKDGYAEGYEAGIRDAVAVADRLYYAHEDVTDLYEFLPSQAWESACAQVEDGIKDLRNES
jgi:hypothetical protein